MKKVLLSIFALSTLALSAQTFVSTTTKLIREHISQAIDGNKIMEMLDKIDSPTEYISAISKLLPYSIGKVKSYEEVEHFAPL